MRLVISVNICENMVFDVGLPLTTIFISINLSTNLSINLNDSFPTKNLQFYLRIFY